MSKELATIPTLEELVEQTELEKKDSALQVLLNQNPHDKWIMIHPISKTKYLPIARVEYLLTYIYQKWWVEVRDVKLIVNSVQVTVRLNVINKITKMHEWNDGVGAVPIHTGKGFKAMQWDEVLSESVMKATPHAKTLAIKDAAEQFGKIFGRDLNRIENFDYSSFIKQSEEEKSKSEREELIELFDKVKSFLSLEYCVDVQRVIENNEEKNYKKIIKHFKSLV